MGDTHSVEYHPLASTPDDAEQAAIAPAPPQRGEKLLNRSLWFIVVLQAAALVFGVFALYAPHRAPTDGRIQHRALYSPAQDVLEYEVKTFSVGFVGDPTPFQTTPSPEVDAEWDALYQCESARNALQSKAIAGSTFSNQYTVGISRIPKSQASRLANKTEPIAGDDGHYIVELDVFHQIHCLNMIRKALYPDYYPAMRMNNTHNIEHVSHCVDNIRQALMCSSDISTIVWQWEPSMQQSIAKGNVAHTCRNFDKIRDWALGHTLPISHNDYKHVEDDIVIPIYHTNDVS